MKGYRSPYKQKDTMAIGLVMQFPGGNAETYDAVMEKLGLEGASGDWPQGIISHFAGAYPSGWCVVDVWESQDSFDAFMRDRLGPATQELSVPEPQGHPYRGAQPLQARLRSHPHSLLNVALVHPISPRRASPTPGMVVQHT